MVRKWKKNSFNTKGKFDFLLMGFIYFAVIFIMGNAYTEEASFSIRMKMKKIVSVSVMPTVPEISISPGKGDFILPHFLSVFLSYNGFSSIRLCLASESGDREFFFSNNSQKIQCTLINGQTYQPISTDGELYVFDGDSPNPLVRKEFLVGVRIDEKELSKAGAGDYECSISAVIYEEY